MDDTLLRQQLRQSEERNEALGRELASLRASLDRVLEEFGALRRDYEALVDATRIITDERNTLRQRVAELEAAWVALAAPLARRFSVNPRHRAKLP